MDDNQCIQVQQLLFGYDSGHRLIAGSFNLDKSSANTALILSDLSGHGSLPPETGYLTGYPLPTIGMYAVARTWLATEMPRPGCVWTHTLLFDFSDLADLTDLRFLSLFRRPETEEGYRYNAPISLALGPRSNFHVPIDINTFKDYFTVLMDAIYNFPEQDVYAHAENEEVESLTLLLWLQQWPRLRRNFRFCTWSESDRSKPRDRFDLQFVSSVTGHAIKRRNMSAKWVDLRAPIQNEMLTDRNCQDLSEAVCDVLEGNRYTSFRKFLWRYGAETDGGRSSFVPLLLLYRALEEHIFLGPETLIEAIKGISPPIQSLYTLVMNVIVTSLAEGGCLSVNVLDFVLSNLSLLDDITDRFATNIATYSLENAPNKLWPLFKSSVASERRVAVAASHILSPADIINVVNDPETFAAILHSNPQIAAKPELWDAPDPVPQMAGWIFVNHFEVIPSQVLDGMLHCNNRDVPYIGLQIFGFKAIQLTVEYLDRTLINENKARQWLCAGQGAKDFIVAALGSHEITKLKTLEIISDFINYRHRPASPQHDDFALALLRINPLPYDLSSRFCAFLLARAFSRVSPDPLTFIRYGFERLHSDLLFRNLDEGSWEILLKELPEVSAWKMWDRGHRLRLAILDLLSDLNISAADFGKIIPADDYTMGLFRNSARDSARLEVRRYFGDWDEPSFGDIFFGKSGRKKKR